MVERPILFSAPMVRALLAGQKTQTRRVVKGEALDWLQSGGFTPCYVADPGNRFCRYGYAGDALWVREAWSVDRHEPCEPHERDYQELLSPTVRYLADDATLKVQGDRATGVGVYRGRVGSGRPSIHMPRWACRQVLEVVGVRIERLHDITEADAEAEGVREASMGDIHLISPQGCGVLPRAVAPPLLLWEFLWKQINGDASWDANPWVWVVEFKPLQPAISGEQP